MVDACMCFLFGRIMIKFLKDMQLEKWFWKRFSYPTHQIVFCTEDALKTLIFKGGSAL
jgi:hypothetical protein